MIFGSDCELYYMNDADEQKDITRVQQGLPRVMNFVNMLRRQCVTQGWRLSTVVVCRQRREQVMSDFAAFARWR